MWYQPHDQPPPQLCPDMSCLNRVSWSLSKRLGFPEQLRWSYSYVVWFTFCFQIISYTKQPAITHDVPSSWIRLHPLILIHQMHARSSSDPPTSMIRDVRPVNIIPMIWSPQIHQYVLIWRFPKSSIFDRIFLYKPSIWGYLHWWKPPNSPNDSDHSKFDAPHSDFSTYALLIYQANSAPPSYKLVYTPH